MYCKKCGKELKSTDHYCPVCGAEVEEVTSTTATPEIVEPKPLKVWSIFATVGKVLGIVSIVTSVLPILLGLSLGIPGIVLSCLGKKAKTPEAYKKCKIGLILSIIGVVVSFISYVLLLGIAGSAGSGYYQY